MPVDALARRFVPLQLDVSDFSELEPLYQILNDRPISSVEDLEQWLVDFSELASVISEYASRSQIDYSCHTDDKEKEQTYLHYIEDIAPKIKPLGFQLQKKYFDCGLADQLGETKFNILSREWREEVDLFRDENIPLQTEAAKLIKDYDKRCGEMLVKFQGDMFTMQQMAKFLEESDRDVRQKSWELVESRRAQDRQPMEALFDHLLELRAEIAANAGMDSYVDYMWRSLGRFDYMPDDCSRFAEAIEAVCMPAVKALNEQRRKDLQLDRLRPWDLAVDPHGAAPLRPFDPKDVEQLRGGCQKIFDRLSPDLAKDFSSLKFGQNLDLDSRKGKRPGGYQASLPESKQPFIFMNAAGLHRDVETMLHEAGHAFHYMWSCHEPIYFLQHAPMEFCEVASMAMELLADEHINVFYDGEEVRRAVKKHLEGIIRIFPWIATIDQFQHWLYTHAGHTVDQRTAAWRQIRRRFSDPAIDWSGYEHFADAMWQRQLHLYHVPFYYVEYGIAQLGALQVWLKSREDREGALEKYRAGLTLGGTRSLPELFSTAGIHFDFSEQTLRPLIAALLDELAS